MSSVKEKLKSYKIRFNKNNILSYIMSGVVLSTSIFIGATMQGDNYKENTQKLYQSSNDISDGDMLKEVESHLGIKVRNENYKVFHAVIHNENLDDETKELIYSLEPIISENPYINGKIVYDEFKKLRIEYVQRPSNYDESTLAIYSKKDHKISVFQSKDKANKEILLHELIHVLFTNPNTVNLPKYILEGMTELLTNEYVSTNPFIEKNTYPIEISIIKILCDMVGPDNVLYSYTTGDMESIKDSLRTVLDKSQVDEFMDNLELIFNEFETKEIISVKAYNNVVTTMDLYFYTKFSENNDLLKRYEYNKGILNLIYDEEPYKEYEKYLNENGVIPYAYFSNILKEKYQNSNNVYIDNKKLYK